MAKKTQTELLEAVLVPRFTADAQRWLDDFARTREYRDIFTATTYANSGIPQYKAEADYCISLRDATWVALYAYLGEVASGQRPIPSSFQEIVPELPTPAWPE